MATWTDWTDIEENDALTHTLINQVGQDLMFLRNSPGGVYTMSVAAADITTTSTTFVDLTDFVVNITTQGGAILIEFDARVNSTNARFDFLVDSVSITADNDGLGAVTPASTFGNNSFRRRYQPASPGTYEVKVQWRVTTGTGTVYAEGLNQLSVREEYINAA